jgi:Permuted papain-like amidase enzyme, YaeF/YiiX, C92 family
VYHHGDLVFSQIGTNANAISAVTRGYNGARLNHMGVIVKNNAGWFVLEAFPPEVRVTQIDVFKRRSANPLGAEERYVVMRLASTHRALISPAVQYGLSVRDTPYDQLYLTDPTSLYCSELVVDMFRSANGGMEFFAERPMSFRDRVTGQVLPAWVEYYDKFGMSVPDGQPGSNPGDISTDVRLDLVEVQGPPGGYGDA